MGLVCVELLTISSCHKVICWGRPWVARVGSDQRPESMPRTWKFYCGKWSNFDLQCSAKWGTMSRTWAEIWRLWPPPQGWAIVNLHGYSLGTAIWQTSWHQDKTQGIVSVEPLIKALLNGTLIRPPCNPVSSGPQALAGTMYQTDDHGHMLAMSQPGW